ncbi:MAG: hypothetical protein VB141_11360 [Burkholderia gladioli]
MKDNHDRTTLELPVIGQRRPGRQKTSPLTPQKQNAVAQRTRRDKMAQAGYVWRGFWLDKRATEALSGLKSALGCSSQDEALERLLRAASSPAMLAELARQPQTED